MTTEHRKAPRRDVVRISREGAWGAVKYHHLLSCGHTETRQRASESKRLACAWCLRAKDKDNEIKALSPAKREPSESLDEAMVEGEINLSKIKASISAKFRIPIEAVDIVAVDDGGQLRISHALIFLSSADVSRIANT